MSLRKVTPTRKPLRESTELGLNPPSGMSSNERVDTVAPALTPRAVPCAAAGVGRNRAAANAAAAIELRTERDLIALLCAGWGSSRQGIRFWISAVSIIGSRTTLRSGPGH